MSTTVFVCVSFYFGLSREKVARDEAEDARRREEDEARKRSHALDKNIRRLRRRNDTPVGSLERV